MAVNLSPEDKARFAALNKDMPELLAKAAAHEATLAQELDKQLETLEVGRQLLKNYKGKKAEENK
jgi:hypothetical protein